MKKQIKVLVIFGNVALYGQERANIDVFFRCKKRGIESLFITNKRLGHFYIKPYLAELELSYKDVFYPDRLHKRMSLLEWIKNILLVFIGNVQVVLIALRYRPTHIHIANEMMFVTMFPALLLLPQPILYLLGDEPLSGHVLFRFFWKRIIIPRVSQFVCISDFVKKSLINVGATRKQIKVILNSPPNRCVFPHDIDKINILRNSNYFTVTYMGQINQAKGVDCLVKAALELCPQYPPLRFLIAGEYSEDNLFAKDLIQKVKEKNLYDRIIFLGYVEAVPQLLALSQLHVCPSVWQEPLSLVVPEAKLSGVPSVVFPSGGLPELIEHKVDGFICNEKSSTGLIEGILFFLEDKKHTRDAGQNAFASIKKLGIDNFTSQWQSVYESI